MNYETIINRVQRLFDLRKELLKNVDDLHVKLQQGNSKTGRNCYTVSLLPIIDCTNCNGCDRSCYDICNVCWQPRVQTDRARNSAIHKADIERFFNEISFQVKAFYASEIRYNVGGDFGYEDFGYVNKVARENPKCDFLFFTKSYNDVNKWYDEGNEFESNVQCIFSEWRGMAMYNPYNFPVAHVLYKDGFTTAPEFGSYFCSGNCSECHFHEKGCWTLKKGESVIFEEH